MTARAWAAAVVFALVVSAPLAAQCLPALVPVSQPVVFPNRAAGPLAWSGNVYGVAKLDADPSSSNAISFAIYDPNLNQIRPDVLVAPSSLDGPRIVLWNGSEFAVFYQSPALQLVLQRINTNGDLLGSPIAVAPSHVHAFGEEYDAAWDSTRKVYVILHTLVYGFERGLWLTTVATDGTNKSDDEVNFFIPNQVFPRVAVTPGGTIGVVWQRLVNGDQQELVFALVAPRAVPTNITTIRAGGFSPRLATDGRVFFVVYTQPLSGGGSALRSMKFTTAGAVAAADAQLLATGQDNVAFSLIANPVLAEWALLYVAYPIGIQAPQFGETRLRRLPFAGGFTDEPFSPVLTKRTFPPRSELTFDGRGYVASIGRVLSLVEGTETYLARHCPFVVSISASTTVASPFVPITFTANPDAGAAPYTFTWNLGDLSSSTAQSVTHAYSNVGTYTVTVTATDNNGSSTTSSITITIANLRRRPAKHI